MRQIPKSGEYCGNCLCRNADVCLLYVEQLSFDIQALRDTQCLRDKPQVLTFEERAHLALSTYRNIGVGEKEEEATDEHR